MDFTLKPRLIIVSGISAAGKTTVAEGLACRISNAIYLSRDHVAYGGLLYVDHLADTSNLPAFEEYIANDKVFPNDAEEVETPFGSMMFLHDSARSDCYKRHARNQGYLIQGRVAAENMKAGKVAVVEGFSELMAREQPKAPKNLDALDHLWLDTSSLTPERAIDRCVEYVVS